MNKTPTTKKGNATRARILSRARQVLIDEGYDKMVLRDVAARTDIKVGNLQYYFAGREALFEGVAQAEIDSDLEAFAQAAARHDDPEAALRAIILELVKRWYDETAPVYRTLSLLTIHNPRFRPLANSISVQCYTVLEVAIERRRPGLKKDVYRDRARLVSALIDGAFLQTGMGPRAEFRQQVIDCAVAIALQD